MTFTSLSDDYSDDCWTLSDAAVRLHTDGLVWSNRKLLDLRIPIDDLPRFSRCPDAIGDLLKVKWWRREGDVYVIRHHAQYQRTREQVVAQQEANRINGAKGGRARWQGRETQSPSESPSESPSKRDRKGKAVKESSSEAALELVHGWPVHHVPHCEDCGWTVDSEEHANNCEVAS